MNGNNILLIESRSQILSQIELELQHTSIILHKETDIENARRLLAILDFNIIIISYEIFEIADNDFINKLVKYNQNSYLYFIISNDIEIPKVQKIFNSRKIDFIFHPINMSLLKSKVHFLLDLQNKISDQDNIIKYLENKNEKLLVQKNQAEELTNNKAIFLANMSHEIRSPMNGIIGLLRILQQSSLSPEQTEMINAVAVSGENLIKIVDDILDYSKIEAKKVKLEEIDFSLKEIAYSVSQLLELKSREKDIELIVDYDDSIPGVLIGDALRLNQILMNLTTNAIKFTEKGSVKISIECFKKTSNLVAIQFVVKDTGIGISEENKKMLFSNYIQSDSSITRKYGGTGLGLSISKNLIELMGGSIELESKLGEGSQFSFILNFKHRQNTTNIQNMKEISLPSSLKVLVAEDNPLNQKVAELTLRKLGLKCTIVENGQEALDLHKDNLYDVILMDVNMPVLDGISTVKKIREFENENQIDKACFVVALTASTFYENKDECIEAGMNDFISKPFRDNELKKILHEAVLNS
ncbi:MAG: ATP-binding protein [Marinifilaceae bacterium]|jgi:signal transduction histidine kinase/CheY-like chemotaxis protein|nr:ATP-binding protein [Marinifilaceae bacterium]